MSRNAKGLAAALVLLAAGAAAFLFLHRPLDHPVARITLDGTLVAEVDLTAVDAPYTIPLEGPGGFSNTVLVEPGRICVREAGCPDQVCVKQGFISDGTVPIVCLPNKLVIQIVGGGEDLDAAAG